MVLALALVSSCVGATTATAGSTTAAGTGGSGRADARMGVADDGAAAAAPLPACVVAMTPAQKVAQVLMVLVPSPLDAAGVVERDLVGGYALVGAQSADVAAEIAATAQRARLPLLAAGDEEGGTVQRFRDVLGAIPAARALADGGTAAEAGQLFADYAGRLRGLGLNMNLGPSLDVGGGSGLGTRSYGTSVDVVSEFGSAVIDAVRSQGLVPVAKHWPGIGAGVADPHRAESPIAGVAALRAKDMVPFDRAFAAGLDAVMVSHAIVPDLTDGLPVSLSRPAITGELRGRHGFDGLVVTDSLGMGAVAAHYDNAGAAVVSIAAGADIALLSGVQYVDEAFVRVLAATQDGTIGADQLDRSVARVLAAKGITGDCP